MEIITLHLPRSYLEGLEKLIAWGIYPNRSEAIRVAVRDLLKNEVWSRKDE